ncbi:MAG: DMT family transporter [Paracoccaceae bacterium]|nr:DMT family transporter [Paracoccaceae bacterium]MDE2913655.1 DMT family transporter [Paracoccaceae bacterium]
MFSPAALGHLSMLAFSLLIAGSFSIGVRIANLMDPTALTAIRFLISGMIVGICAAFGPGFRREHFRGAWRYGVLGVLFATYFVLMFEGLKTAPAVSASAVFTLTPILSGVAGYFILRQVMTGRMALALAVGACGALWVIFRADPVALLQVDIGYGEAIYLVGCGFHAVYTPMIARLSRGEPAMVVTFGMTVSGFLYLAALSLPELLRIDWTALPWVFWAGLVYLAVFSSSMSFFFLSYASVRLPSAKVMAYTYLTPSWVTAWEFALTGDLPPPLILAGIGATVIAVLLLVREPGPVT